MAKKIDMIVAKDPTVLRVLTDLDVSMHDKFVYINKELAKHNLPLYESEDEMFIEIIQGDRSDAEFMRDLRKAEYHMDQMKKAQADRERQARATAQPSSSSSQSSSSGGCYVATAAYGSYDCPEVWVLRRFRDDYLAQSGPGRAFIKTYYAVSPTAVKILSPYTWFNNGVRNILDKWVRKLKAHGYSDAPYSDN